MSAGWVAGSVRAQAIARRRLGRESSRELAAETNIEQALQTLTGGSYGHDVRPGLTIEQAQHAIRATLLWHLRVLAGWQPRAGAELVRRLAAWFEIANVEELLRQYAGEPAEPTYELGSLATSWPRLAVCGSPAELRHVLATTPWDDPGGDGAYEVGMAMRFRWAQRVADLSPLLVPWAAGAAALLLAHNQLQTRRTLPPQANQAASALLGQSALSATSLPELTAALDSDAAWVLHGIDEPADLWRAEARWWRRVEEEGFTLLHSLKADSRPLLGAVAVLAADARRVCAALELSARGGAPLEAFDAVA